MSRSSAAHRRQQCDLGAVRDRVARTRESAIDGDGQMRLELAEARVFVTDGGEQIANATAFGQIESLAVASGALAGLGEEQNGDVHAWTLHGSSLYARRMDCDNQEGPPGTLPGDEPRTPERHDWSVPPPPPPSVSPGEPPAWEFAVSPGVALPASERAARGLAMWLAILAIFGIGGLLFHMEELAAMVAISGLFVLSQAADIDPRWRYLHYTVSWVVPAGGFVVAIMIGYQVFVQTDASSSVRMLVTPALVVAALVCVLSAPRPFANLAAMLLFRVQNPSHTLRLAARMTLVTLVLALPGWFALRSIFDELFNPSAPLIDRASLEGQLVGYVLLALASVGFMIRRSWKESLERLGIGAISANHLAIVALGVVALYGLNAGGDWIQQTFFHDLWDSDHQVNQMIASGLGTGKIALLGLSAGIGEEITLRGALQPKLGLLMTSLLFASLHLQYSWFGMVVIFLLSLILGTIRMKTNTTVAMAVHAVYDVLALISV